MGGGKDFVEHGSDVERMATYPGWREQGMGEEGAL